MLLLLSACETPEPEYGMTFADVVEPTLNVNWYETPGQEGRLQVLVNPEHIGHCRPLPELTANVDGVALARLHGRYEDEVYSYDRDCTVYEFEARAPALASVSGNARSVVTVTDGAKSLSVAVNHLFTPRKLVLTGQPGTLPETLHFRVEPTGDIVGKDPKFGFLLQSGDRTARADATLVEGFFRLVMPPEFNSADTTITLTGAGYLQPSFDGCTATACTAARSVAILPFVPSPAAPGK